MERPAIRFRTEVSPRLPRFGGAGLVLVPFSMAGAQVCVDPAGGGCQLTIQAGVDVAAAGQRIDIATDNVGEGCNVATIQNDPIGLTLTGKGSSGNRGDDCESIDTGTVTDRGGGSFAVAGAPACEVDHDF